MARVCASCAATGRGDGAADFAPQACASLSDKTQGACEAPNPGHRGADKTQGACEAPNPGHRGAAIPTKTQGACEAPNPGHHGAYISAGSTVQPTVQLTVNPTDLTGPSTVGTTVQCSLQYSADSVQCALQYSVPGSALWIPGSQAASPVDTNPYRAVRPAGGIRYYRLPDWWPSRPGPHGDSLPASARRGSHSNMPPVSNYAGGMSSLAGQKKGRSVMAHLDTVQPPARLGPYSNVPPHDRCLSDPTAGSVRNGPPSELGTHKGNTVTEPGVDDPALPSQVDLNSGQGTPLRPHGQGWQEAAKPAGAAIFFSVSATSRGQGSEGLVQVQEPTSWAGGLLGGSPKRKSPPRPSPPPPEQDAEGMVPWRG